MEQTFPARLYNLLEERGKQRGCGPICWTKSGSSFIVVKEKGVVPVRLEWQRLGDSRGTPNDNGNQIADSMCMLPNIGRKSGLRIGNG